MEEQFVEFEFHYASINLKPRAGAIESSERLLRDIIDAMNHKDFPPEYRVIDKHEKRQKTHPRKLVHISSPLERGGGRCFGKIALIKNKAPMMWGGKDLVEEIQKDKNKKFIEMTNYVINFNTNSDPVIMVEFNSSGPRLSDIEYYLRQVSSRYKLARSIQTTYHLDLDYYDLESKLTNVFDVTVKLDTTSHIHTKSASWYKPFSQIREETGYKDVKMEFFFGRKKETNGKYVKNIKGLDYARNVLAWLKADDKNIEHIEDLKMTYELENTFIKDLDFMKNKTTSFVYVNLIPNSTKLKRSDFNHHVGQEFNYYLTEGKTNPQKEKE